MARVEVGLSIHPDSREAGMRAARRALRKGQTPAPADHGVLVLTSGYDLDQVLAGIQAEVPDFPLFGATAEALLTNLGQIRTGVYLAWVKAQDAQLRLCQTRGQGNPEASAQDFAQKLAPSPGARKERQFGLLITGDGTVHSSEYLEALNQALPYPLPMVGGGAVGREGDKVPGTQILGEELYRDALGCLVFEGTKDALPVGFAFESSWSPIAPPVRVTHGDLGGVYEVDHRPVLEYLEEILGADFQAELASTVWKYSFLARYPDPSGDHFLIRTPQWGRGNSGIRFYPRAPMQDVEIQLIQISRPEMLDGAQTAAEASLRELGGAQPAAVFAFSCQLRKRFLHSRADDETRRISEVFGPSVPIFGTYAGGEYGPLYPSFEAASDPAQAYPGTRQLSTSISLLALGEAAGTPPREEENLAEIFRSWCIEDRNCETNPKALMQRIEEITRLLESAETMIDETERALKHVNHQHVENAEALRLKNRQLAESRRQGDRLQRILRQYTPHLVWSKAQESVHAGLYTIPDEELQLTLFFMDVKGFTSYAEEHSSHEVIAEINRIFEPATAIIYDHGGDIDKYIGDCIFAVFPEPLPAVESALEIQSMVDRLREQGLPFGVRVGIHQGRVVAGNVGGNRRRDNTLIGDAVNLAQRLESQCKPGSVLVSKPVYLGIRDELPLDLEIQRRRIDAKGKREPVEAFELRGGTP